MNIKIKNMTTQDIDQATDIFYRSFNSVGEKWDLPTADKRIKQYFNPDTCWVAEDESKIVGILVSKLDNVLDHQELYIDVIAVDPNYHNSGIGSKLLKAAEDYAKEQGFKGVWLCASTELKSFDWYLKIGFQETSWKTLFKKI